MWIFLVLTGFMLFGVLYGIAKGNQQEVLNNWEKYNKNPFFVFFMAPFYKPDDDERSRFQFGIDNFFNVLMTFCTDTMQVVMQPLMAIFKMMTDAVDQTASGLFNMRDLLKVMWTRFNSMTAGFMNRFQGALVALRATYTKLYNAIGKTFAISIAGLMSGLAALQTTLSIFDLIVNVVITILVILAAIFIWLPFILIPVIGIIIVCINAINASGQGDRMTGIAGVFCFAEGTRIETSQGRKPIETIQMNDVLADGGVVKGILNFEQPTTDMYDLYGVQVSGSHIVYTPTGPVFVENHHDAVPIQINRKVFCFLTTTRRIPVYSTHGRLDFADWEEIEDTPETLKMWNQQVFQLLNPGITYIPAEEANLVSEAGFTGDTLLFTGPDTYIQARNVYPGCSLLDTHGHPTKVRGVVRLSACEVPYILPLFQGHISAGTWIKNAGIWTQPSKGVPNSTTEDWYQFFTEAGTLLVQDGAAVLKVRDFTDVGSTEIHKTYDWVLKTLAKKI
jgi:hypothetical protein